MSALGVGSVLNMGVSALFASQANISTVGNNISNVNTPGYTRRSVLLQEKNSIDYYPGQAGQGVQAVEVFRYFDKFVENALHGKLSTASRYQAEYSLLRNVETVFNEANVSGISDALAAMYKSWNTLAQEPDSMSAREALLATAQTLATSLRNADQTMASLQDQMNRMIGEEVTKANTLINEIANLNREINAHTVNGRNNANELMDLRDQKVRELAEIIDIHVDDKGAGNYMVTTSAGNMLVQGDIAFSLEVRGPQAENHLSASSPYKQNGETIQFSGSDTKEYTLEVTTPGAIGSAAKFKVSLDGGRTWVTDEDGNVREFSANGENQSVTVGKLEIWFGNASGTESLAAGDKFVISPKTDVYWVSPTSGPINISSQVYGDGTENSLRITGGALGGYLDFRDNRIGEYRGRLAAFTDSLVWEVNRLHSQGAGLNPITLAMGTYGTLPTRTNVPLGGAMSGLHYADRLAAGNVSFAVYDTTTGKSIIPYPGISVFSPTNFDPSVHSLEDVRDAINAVQVEYPAGSGTTVNPLSATIVNGKLQINAMNGMGFNIASDTTGLAAALGINTFFVGESPSQLGIRDELSVDANLVNAGRVNGAGEGNKGDNITAKEIAALATKVADITSFGRKTVKTTMTDYYAAIVTKVGSDTASVKYTAASETAMAQELNQRREEISGVNLDEEMSNLIKFQAAYKAAAKLITTADEMLQTLLSLKQ